jgi:hypothetical protein
MPKSSNAMRDLGDYHNLKAEKLQVLRPPIRTPQPLLPLFKISELAVDAERSLVELPSS